MNFEDKNQKDKRLSQLLSVTDRNTTEPDKEFLNKLQEKTMAEFMTSNAKEMKNPKTTFPLWSIIMKSNIAKIAAAIVIIAAVLIVIHYSGGSIDGSSVVWADVVKKIENSRGYINRIIITGSPGYSICYHSPENVRMDMYENEDLTSSMYFKPDTATYIYHKYKTYTIRERQENSDAGQNQQDSMNPLFMLQAILSFEHRELAPQTIDGVLCEGIETNDFNVLLMMNPEDQADFSTMEKPEFQMTLWINQETQYPVMAEYKLNTVFNGQTIEGGAVLDQFEWDVDFDTDIFVPDIPSDYKKMPNM